MPLLGGLFSRKNKSLRAGDDRSDSLHSTAVSDNDPGPSPTSTASYVHTNRSVPSNPNASNLLHPDSARQIFPYNPPPMMATPTPSSSSSGGSKLRLFGRKKSLAAEAAPSTPEPPRKSFQMAPRPKNDRTSTDTDATDMRRLRPPPSRSAIFAAYGDPNSALSTRSLPNDASHPPTTPFALSPTQPGPPPPPKKSFFGWGKNHPNPPPPLSPSLLDPGYFSNGYDSAGSPTSQDAASFNLRSFRHIRPPSPTGSNVSLTPPVPRPRPRGESVNSDSAQRISVAAFREAQARRSQAGSPSPSFRSTSPAPGLPSGRNSPRPSRSASHVASQQQQRRRSSMALQMTSDSEASASSSEVESEGETAQPGNRTNKALNTPGRTKAKSEIGHGRRAPMASSKSSDFPLHPRVPSSHVGHSSSAAPVPQRRPDENKKSLDAPRPQSTLSVYNSNLRPRASVSTSAITPSSAAKRASIVVAINNRMGNSSGTESRSSPVTPAATPSALHTPQINSQPSKTSVASVAARPPPRQNSSDSDSDSEDDAPLAKLVGPRRPGSAMSSYSNLHARSTGNVTTRSATNMPAKPLIDINELTGPKRSQTAPMEKNNGGFTGGQTLLAQRNGPPPSQRHTPSPLMDSPVAMNHTLPWMTTSPHEQPPLVSTFPPVKFASPMGSPVQEKAELLSNNETPPPPTHRRTSSADMNDKASLGRDSSPEMRRDPITDRLSRAVKNTLQTPPLDTPSHDGASTAEIQQSAFISRDASPALGSASDAPRTQGADNAPAVRPRPARGGMPFPRAQSSADHSPPDAELAMLLGTAVQFLSNDSAPRPTQTTGSSSSSSGSDDEHEPSAPVASKERIAPIPIKQRSPPPSFSVTSRPPLGRQNDANSNSRASGFDQRPRSTTLQTSSASSSSFGSRKPSGSESIAMPTHASKQSTSSLSGITALATASAASSAQGKLSVGRPGAGVRQRSSTMITGVPLSAQMNKQPVPSPAPEKPFAMRRNSPASSTGGSSSGRTPLTPRDGSDIGEKKQALEDAEKPRRHIKRRSVSFEDDVEELRPPVRSYLKTPTSSRASSDAGEASTDDGEERRRRERRRSEAKASIELGNVVNGRGPVLDDDDEDMPVARVANPRVSAVNPMMGMGAPMAMQMGQLGFPGSPAAGMWPAGMGMGGGQPMLSPAQFMMPPPADPNFLAAHQQAMAYAKQAYQMAVAQQAMAAAADEWERGSTFGGGSVYGGGGGGGSVYGGAGGGSVYGGGGGGSVYGGSQAASVMGSPFAMMGGMNMMQSAWGSAASMYGGGGGGRSVYGGSQLGVPDMMSSSRSEYGGGGRGGAGNWSSSRSSYGESFGPEQATRRGAQGVRRGAPTPGAGRESGYFPPMPLIPAGLLNNGRNSPELRGKPKSGPSPHRKAAPPSSWKAS